MVRHECAEALGAIGHESSIPTLKKCKEGDDSVEVGQTCALALDYIQWKLNGGVDNDNNNTEDDDDAPAVCACMLSPYNSHDPAPPHPSHASLSTEQIGTILSDNNAPLFQRFRAMFSLRNRGTEEAVHALGQSLIHDTSSPLLRHEVAYVLGQMQHPASVEYLVISLKRNEEHEMVRHESAEALGAIEERWGDCESILKEFLEDENVVVRESCMVALDAADYFGYYSSGNKEQEVDDEADEEQDYCKNDGNNAVNKGDNVKNFSLHKAQLDGKVNREKNGVLHNHFNIAA